MTALIVIGIVLAGLILHFSIGAVAALKLAPKVAEISNKSKTEHVGGGGYYEYEWESNYYNKKNQWLTSGWTPGTSKSDEKWKKTGRQKYVGGVEPSTVETYGFDAKAFASTMAFIRWFWFLGVPAVLNASVDKKILEKYDPEVAERKAIQQANRIQELEKELEIGND